LRQVILRSIPQQRAGVGDVQALEAVIAEPVEDGEFQVLDVDALFDELIEIAAADPGVEHADALLVSRRLDRLERADADADRRDAFLLRHIARQRFAEAFADAVQVARVYRLAGLHLHVRRIAADGVDAGRVNHPPARR